MVSKPLIAALMTSALALSATPALAKDMAKQHTFTAGQPVNLTGTVQSIDGDDFTLALKDGSLIDVNVDDWSGADASDLVKPGDRVQVSGLIEDGLGDAEVDASSIKLAKGGRSFTSEGDYRMVVNTQTVTTTPGTRRGNLELSGMVGDFNGLNFQLIKPNGEIVSIDTEGLGYNPADDDFMPQLQTGDTVRLRADTSNEILGNLTARKIVSITKSYDDTEIMGQTLAANHEPEGMTALDPKKYGPK